MIEVVLNTKLRLIERERVMIEVVLNTTLRLIERQL